MSDGQWPVSDEWEMLGVHWHGHVEEVPMAVAKTRKERLVALPDEVLLTPQEVAAWLAGAVKAAAGLPEDANFGDSVSVWVSLASQGESIVTGVRQQCTVAADAVTDTECDCQSEHEKPAVARLGRRRRS
ncbi:hypothetical protein [Streptoalloteichus hindustanus]|uniref:Uncharacterized protein n=1 Tax=Streptoalloteichus hindustanus TaxID=2017 RepID=A0A1M5H9P2_STRHI|nr:hypothetical protein [Streptoalloteichus hindustanus]SHG12665.1 hypothetical protein SAMN05444320_106464 [Streptoalloteichus hindustanus]